MTNSDWYTITDVDALDTPALVIYPDRVRQNIDRLLTYVDDVSRLRPHVKTHKSPDASRLLLNVGIRKFKCATVAEAEMLAEAGAPDVLLAYQPVGAKQQRLIELIRTYPNTQFSCLIDNIGTAQQLADRATNVGLSIPVYIDLNVGMNRTGIRADDGAATLYDQLSTLPGIQPLGLHAYDGHLRDTDMSVRTARCDAAFAPVAQLREQLRALGYDPIIVAGGSPTFPIHARRPNVECSPGTFIYWDEGYGTILPEQPFEPAALVVGRVISLPTPTTLCIDIGHKSVAAEGELAQRLTFLNALNLRAIGQSEEHLTVDAGDNHTYRVGDVLYGLPHHICPTVALFDRARTIEQGHLSSTWKTTARDRFLTV